MTGRMGARFAELMGQPAGRDMASFFEEFAEIALTSGGVLEAARQAVKMRGVVPRKLGESSSEIFRFHCRAFWACHLEGEVACAHAVGKHMRARWTRWLWC